MPTISSSFHSEEDRKQIEDMTPWNVQRNLFRREANLRGVGKVGKTKLDKLNGNYRETIETDCINIEILSGRMDAYTCLMTCFYKERPQAIEKILKIWASMVFITLKNFALVGIIYILFIIIVIYYICFFI